MFNHISIGVRSIPNSKRFYDAALGAIGYRCLSEDAAYLGYGADQPYFWVYKSEHPVAEDAGSGLHFCLNAQPLPVCANFTLRVSNKVDATTVLRASDRIIRRTTMPRS